MPECLQLMVEGARPLQRAVLEDPDRPRPGVIRVLRATFAGTLQGLVENHLLPAARASNPDAIRFDQGGDLQVFSRARACRAPSSCVTTA